MLKKKTEIKTARLTLKPISDGDKATLLELLTDEEVTKTYMVPEMKTADDAERLFSRLKDLSNSDAAVVYGIFAGDALVGMINDCGCDGEEIELGYAIHPFYKGNGYATEALSAVIAEVFRMGYSRVVCGYFGGNDASRRVMEKCGMTPLDREDTVEYRGETHRCLYYYIDK